jgi:hypothetical protein
VPASIVTGESVDLVDHDGAQIREEPPPVHLDAHQHGFERLRRGEQEIRRVTKDTLPRGR